MNCKVCGNTSAKSTSVSFFRFPKENSKCREWADRCDLLELFERHGNLRFYKSFRICSQHFDPKDVVFDGRKKRLLQSAAPLKSRTGCDNASSSVQMGVKDIGLQFPQKLCRLCAGENENLTEIFGLRGKLLNLEKKLKYFPQVINRNDVLPLKICSPCESKVNQFYDFVMECIKAENKLRAMLEPKDSQTSHQLTKADAEDNGIDSNSEVKSLSQTPKINDSLDPRNCFQETTRPNYYGQVLEENFVCGDDGDHLSRVAVVGFNLSDHSNSHTSSVKVDFSRNISSEQDYSNKVFANDLQTEIQMPNDQNFEEVSKFSCHTCLQSFNDSEALRIHSLQHSVQFGLDREHLNGLHNKDFYNRFQENVFYVGSQASNVCDRFHEVVLLDEISFAQNPCNQSKDFRRDHHIRQESTTKAHLKRVLKCDQTKSGLRGGEGRSEVEGESSQFRKKLSEKGIRVARGKAGKEEVQRCDECGKFLRSKASLRQHKSVHSDKRLYSCQECGLSFKRKDTLCNHVRIHTGERPFVCKVCGFAFKQRGDCKKHENNHDRESEMI